MNKFFPFLYLLLIVILISCGSDDNAVPINEENDIESTIKVLTNDSQKSWRIGKAVLTNSMNTSSVDISNTFNIKDDVFVFSTEIVDSPNLTNVNGSVTWKQREGVNWEASSIDQVYKDFYERETVVGFEVSVENVNVFTGFDGLSDFTLVDENTITGKIKVTETVELDITLLPLLDTDLPIVPTSISFREIATLQFEIGGSADILGVQGSNQLNSLFISKRGRSDFNNPDGCADLFEEIGRYDLSTNTFESKSFCAGTNFSTKEVEIINGKLIVAASDANNVYDIDLNSDPRLVRHDQTFTRHGTASLQNDVYVIGSRLDPLDGPSNKLHVFNTISEDFTVFNELPVSKVWADTEIVDDKLYVFGGEETFGGTLGTDDILIYDFNNEVWETTSMTKEVNDTFTGKYKNLIFVGGTISIDENQDGTLEGKESFIGVFNTIDNTFNEINFDIDVWEDGFFRQLTVLNNKLYVIFDAESMFGATFKLYEADLN